MLDNITVGPPLQGFPGTSLQQAAKPPREDSSGSFSRTLGEKLDPKVPKTVTTADTRQRTVDKAGMEREDSPPREIEAPQAKIPGMKRAEGAREKAIRKFMDSFESEFGIPPTRIVEAMASIEPQKMNEIPEATVADVISQLDLAPEDRERAMAMYAGLLAELQTVPAAPAPPAFMPVNNGMDAALVQKRFETAHAQRATLNQSLDRLNQKFWMKDRTSDLVDGQNPFQGAKAMPDFSKVGVEDEGTEPLLAMDETQTGRLIEGETEQGFGLPPADVEGEPVTPLPGVRPGPSGTPANGLAASTEALSASQGPAPTRMKQVLAEMKKAADEAKRAEIQAKLEASGDSRFGGMAALGAARPAAAASAAPSEGALVAGEANVMGAWSAPVAPKLAGGSLGGGQGFSSSSGESGDGSGDSGSTSSGNGDYKAVAQQTAAPVPLKMEDVAAALKMGVPASAAAMTMSPADNEANVRQLMNQAQYLIKKGGGEVKVVMNPEGLGQVQLKVMLQDGKVNVQMAAETKEAKQAIESTLGDLRSSLAAHKLSVDHVKVDLVSGPNTDNQARNETNQNLNQHQQQRDTKQFWNQFQENFGNRGQREGFLEMPAMKEYRRSSEPKPLEPSRLEGASAPRRSGTDGKGSGLNLVA